MPDSTARVAQCSHNIPANVIHIWLTRFDREELTDDEADASVFVQDETGITALNCKVDQLTMELDPDAKTVRMPVAGSNKRSCAVAALGLLTPSEVRSHEHAAQHLLLPPPCKDRLTAA